MHMDKCSINQCQTYIFARGWCQKHYSRWRNHGSPLAASYIKNGQVKHPLYNTFRSMHQRCEYPKNKHFSYYGGRGITVCERWTGPFGFTNFLADMGERPNGMTLDRVDNDLGYSPENCQWATRSAQQYNQRINRTNTSGTTGVSLFKKTGKWSAYICVDRKRKHLGYFTTIEDAVVARKLAEKEYNLGN